MLIDFEERVVRNPVLGAVLLWNFVFQYEQQQAKPQSPDLLVIMPVLPILLHQDSVRRLKGMRFDSGLTKALVELPTMMLGLQKRLVAFAPLTMTSLNIACAANLLRRGLNSERLEFATAIRRLPKDIEPEGMPRDMASAARRLGAFFAHESPVQIQAKLGIAL